MHKALELRFEGWVTDDTNDMLLCGSNLSCLGVVTPDNIELGYTINTRI